MRTMSVNQIIVESNQRSLVLVAVRKLIGPQLTYEGVELLIRLLKRNQDQDCYILFNLVGVKVLDDIRIMRHLIANQRTISKIKAQAFVVDTHVNRILGHYFSLVMQDQCPMNVFDDLPAARNWLKNI